MKKLLYFILFFIITGTSLAQDSCFLKISLLTCSPGEELYSTFGHTAIRVQDKRTGDDRIFNYGTFEFGPDFYAEFIRGKLLYYLSVEPYTNFRYQYQAESRSIIEQELRISCAAREKLFSALLMNATEENRYYRYDFLFDNCTTRAGDIIAANSGDTVLFRDILDDSRPSFRDQIHSYLDAGSQYWSKLGIDILLGVKLDKKVTNRQSMFLPDYLMKGFDSALLNNRPVVNQKQTILEMPAMFKRPGLFTPLNVFSVFFVLITIASFARNERLKAALRIFDFLFFFILGLTGLLLLFMWFGTDHIVCRNNYNLLWALPFHVIMAFFVQSKKKWVRSYYISVCTISIILALTWFFLPQQLNSALLPILFLIILRSWQISKPEVWKKK